MAKHRFSPSSLSTFRDNPLCFYLDKKMGVARPRGIFPSLPNGMDGIIKTYMDRHRAAGTFPAELEIEGVVLFPDQDRLRLWRNWRTGLAIEIPEADAVLSGAFDDLLVTDDGLYVPFDYKTKGTPTTVEDTIKYYTAQVECYGLMLKRSGFPVAPYAIFSYWSPRCVLDQEVSEAPGGVRFTTQTVKIDINPDNALDLVCRAAACLDSATPPAANPDNEYDAYFRKRTAALAKFA